MEDKNLINLIKNQQEKIDKLEEDQDDLLKGYDALLRLLTSKNAQIAILKGE